MDVQMDENQLEDVINEIREMQSRGRGNPKGNGKSRGQPTDRRFNVISRLRKQTSPYIMIRGIHGPAHIDSGSDISVLPNRTLSLLMKQFPNTLSITSLDEDIYNDFIKQTVRVNLGVNLYIAKSCRGLKLSNKADIHAKRVTLRLVEGTDEAYLGFSDMKELRLVIDAKNNVSKLAPNRCTHNGPYTSHLTQVIEYSTSIDSRIKSRQNKPAFYFGTEKQTERPESDQPGRIILKEDAPSNAHPIVYTVDTNLA